MDNGAILYYGGGIYCQDTSNAQITDNVIDSNTAGLHGGGIYIEDSSPLVRKNKILRNTAVREGGGIHFHLVGLIVYEPQIDSNTISNNMSLNGAGISCWSYRDMNCGVTIARNAIYDNIADTAGGGIFCYGYAYPTIDGNTLHNNSALQGGGLCFAEDAHPVVKNNIVSNSQGEGLYCSGNSNPLISYNDVWHSSGDNFYHCPPGIGDTSWDENCNHTPCDSFYNIIQDPLFDPDSTNYFLLCNSPCIDAGDPSDPVPEGGGRYVDMGAVEYPYLCGDANGDGNHDAADVVFKINYLYIHGPAPCPLGAADDDRDCNVNAADIVYEINYLYIQGPPPVCGGKEPSLANPLSKLHPTPGFAEISLSEPRFVKDGFGEITITGKFDIELAAVQLEVNYDPKQIELIEPALSPRCEGLQIYFGSADGQLKIGILDINGKHRIPAGEGPILTLKAKAKDLSSLKISEAILVDQNANAFLANVVEKFEVATSLPDQYSLHQNYPNPFNPETQISYDLPNDSWVKLSIYNIRGQKVKTLVDGFEAAGHKVVIWDGTNEEGEQVASGVYFYRLDAGEFTATKKMVLLR